MNSPKESIHLKSQAAHTRLLINNEDRSGKGDLLRVVNPATEELVAEFPGASVAQVDEAVTSEKAAFDSAEDECLKLVPNCASARSRSTAAARCGRTHR